MIDGLFPVYIPSKGRSGKSQTMAGLDKEDIPYVVFVEPQEFDAYRKSVGCGEVIQIGGRDKGIAYVRQYIHMYAASAGVSWYWMLDDDIQSIYTVSMGKCVKMPWRTLSQAQRTFARLPNVGQAALEYQQFAWSASKPLAWNSYCDVCVCNNVGLTSALRYRSEYDLKEDRDFTLQVLASGFSTVRTTKFAFSAPANGSNAGGLQELYAQKTPEIRASQALAAGWGKDICTVVKKPNGRIDAKINWRYFKSLK